MSAVKTPSTSGERLRRARILAGIATRREFEENHRISANTLQGWEQGKNPLSKKGAQRITEALKQEGLICTVEWLLHGSGMPPQTFETGNAGTRWRQPVEQPLSESNLREEGAIYQEVQVFKNQHPNAILLSIMDDAMEPFFSAGDQIAGVRVPNEDIPNYVGTLCIIELENNLILPRQLHASNQPGRYTVSCTNPKAATAPLNVYDVRVVSAAPIIWHRRKLTTLCSKKSL